MPTPTISEFGSGQKPGEDSHLQSQLSTIQHGFLERVLLLFQIRLGPLSRREEVFKNDRQQTFPLILFREEIYEVRSLIPHIDKRKKPALPLFGVWI
jgi:hypothetical protein